MQKDMATLRVQILCVGTAACDRQVCRNWLWKIFSEIDRTEIEQLERDALGKDLLWLLPKGTMAIDEEQ